MGKGDRKRRRLFDLYAANLRLIHPAAPDVIGCPICRCTLTRNDLLGPNPKVTLAHIQPRATGGRKVCLCCANCNNTIGSRFEAALEQEAQLAAWWNGQQSMRVRGTPPDTDVTLELEFSVGRDTLDVREVRKQTNPSKWSALFTNPPTEESRLSLSMPTPELPDLVVASIHSAFLHLFYHFGYEYVLHENVEKVRRLLLGEADPEAFRQAVFVLPGPAGAPEALIDGAHILYKPAAFACFLVLQPLPWTTDVFRTVAMPGLRPNGRSGFEAILARGSSVRQFRAVTLDGLPPIDERLANPNYRGIGHAHWDRTFRAVQGEQG